MGYLNSIQFIILSITLYQYVLHLPVAANNVLTPGDVLNNTDLKTILVSPNGMFSLGFFTSQNTNIFYLGIWYTNEAEGIKVWIANRDTPIIGSGVLLIDDSGSLKVVNDRGITLFNVFYNQIGSGNKIRAVLEDSGNFVVQATNQNNRILWESFDHPTDVLLDGMKLGYNLTTKQNWTLTSSLNDQVPALGAFTMKLEYYENSPQILIYRRRELYWASGPLMDRSGPFLRVLALTPFQFILISDPSGMYIYFNKTGDASSTLQLSPMGQFIDSTNNIDLTPEFCYDYLLSGCKVSAFPYCRDPIGHYWETGYSIRIPNKYDDNPNISIGDCMKICWNDCNCAACLTNNNGTGCRTWTRDELDEYGLGLSTTYYDFDSANPTKVYVLVSNKAPKSKKWIWITVSLAGMFTSVLLTYLCHLCCVRIRKRKFEEKEIRKREDFIHQLIGSNSFNFSDELEKGFKDAPDVKIFSLKAILAATNNFSDDNKLGQGGYGPVYKGQLFDGRKIAIKRLSKTSGQGILEFKSELILISKLQHTNLVRLYGCCLHQEEKMLIYEFMPNKSLDFFLFDKDRKGKIDWKIRFNIIEGVAQGLLYLHKYSRMRIVHRDLKVSNILLDENMNPKIADFGMARIFHSNMTEGTTHRIVGTYGYMAPEYAMQGTFSIKSDVFSFGVLVLEIISGKKNSSFYKYDMPLTLVRYAWELWKKEAVLEIKDGSLGESYDVKQLHRCIHVGLLCVQDNANDRPTMSEVISMLNNEIIDLPIPKQPVFFTQPNAVQPSKSNNHLLSNNIQVSLSKLTFTTMEAR